MGLGFNYLIFICREIAAENGIIYSLAVEQFFESLERQYDIKLKLWKYVKGISVIRKYFLIEIESISMTHRNLILYTKVHGCKYMRIPLDTKIIIIVIQSRYSIELR
jgi:hypothetical protein